MTHATDGPLATSPGLAHRVPDGAAVVDAGSTRPDVALAWPARGRTVHLLAAASADAALTELPDEVRDRVALHLVGARASDVPHAGLDALDLSPVGLLVVPPETSVVEGAAGLLAADSPPVLVVGEPGAEVLPVLDRLVELGYAVLEPQEDGIVPLVPAATLPEPEQLRAANRHLSASLSHARTAAQDASGPTDALRAALAEAERRRDSDARQATALHTTLRTLARLRNGSGQEAPESVAGLSPRREVRMAVLLDEFSLAGFAPEAEVVELTPEGWEAELEAHRPELLLVESAWLGKGGAWSRRLTAVGPEIAGILEWCREHEVPTVFWNKEDPVHFETFLSLASRFDVVLTSDMDCVPRYRHRLGHDRVHFFPFAAQTRVHHPLERFERQDAFAFAGAYYERYPERAAALRSFEATLPQVKPFIIFDRNFTGSDARYQFPPGFEKYIAGRLEPEEIDLAYKGFTVAVNLSSVQHSQTMLARRVYEVMASNTLVVSNYVPSLRTLFGDLVIASDQGSQVVRRLEALAAAPHGEERVRAQALRTVLRQHTYDDRMQQLADLTGVARERFAPRVALVATAASHLEVWRAADTARRQTWPADRTVVVTRGLGTVPPPDGVTVIDEEALSGTLAELAPGCTHVAFLDPRDHYGDAYVEDLVLAHRYAQASVVARSARFRAEGAQVVERPQPGYGAAASAAPRRALLTLAEHGQMPAAQLLAGEDVSADVLAIDGFEHVEGGAGLAAATLAGTSADAARSGLPLAQLSRRAESAPLPQQEQLARALPLEPLAEALATPSAAMSARLEDGALRVTSTAASSKPDYLYADQDIPLDDLGWGSTGALHVDADQGRNIRLVALFHDRDGERLGHTFAVPNASATFDVPEGTATVQLGFRAGGPGELVVRRILPEALPRLSAGVTLSSRHVVLTNNYPGYDDLYQNAFVHSRVRRYLRSGLDVTVIRLTSTPTPVFREFEGVDVIEMNADCLRETLRGNHVDAVMVHFLRPEMWDVLKDPSLVPAVRVWVHGAEIQPWHRRAFNLADAVAVERAKAASAEREKFWGTLLAEVPEHVRLVFVSQWFADQVQEDYQVTLPADACHVIHNPIDTDLFAYRPKPVEQRTKILSVRPYATRTYANDLAVAAVLALRDEPFFERLSFTFVGDGPLFDETLAPLRDLPNVTIRRGFLPQQEIAALHREHGVLLIPSRLDSHGVSRDEGMSSGLVPVTSAVAAVPEFVDDTCGFLAPAEDHEVLAQAIATLYREPERFAAMSAAAAARVRGQAAAGRVVEQELALVTTDAAT